MKRNLVTLVFCCIGMCLFFTETALSNPPEPSGQILGLTQALSLLSPDELAQVLKGLGIPPAPLPKTGQTTPWYAGDDGSLQKGVPWPNPRFTDNDDGTVTDNLTGLIWLKNASTFDLSDWNEALSAANTLASGMNGLTDGCQAGDWRLPNIRELQSLIDFSQNNPALPVGHPFTNVNVDYLFYWSSTSFSNISTAQDYALTVYFGYGYVSVDGKTHAINV
jgi:hypothetical protein